MRKFIYLIPGLVITFIFLIDFIYFFIVDKNSSKTTLFLLLFIGNIIKLIILPQKQHIKGKASLKGIILLMITFIIAVLVLFSVPAFNQHRALMLVNLFCFGLLVTIEIIKYFRITKSLFLKNEDNITALLTQA